jgi:2-methylfumaryl-CoA hydratase
MSALIQKSSRGNFFEDFCIGQELTHAVPRTITAGDVALYSALYGMRFGLQSSDAFAQANGLPCAPIDNLLLFHVIFGKTVPDISLNAVANLGYAECRFLAPAFPGDSFTARSEVIGLKENSSGKTGIVYVRSTGYNQRGIAVLSFIRWVMVNKGDANATAPDAVVPHYVTSVDPKSLAIPENLDFARYDGQLGGGNFFLEDYAMGEKIDHVDGMTIEEAEHTLATKLYQNTAKGHFDALLQKSSRFGRRIVYGGHVMSLARSLSFNGLANGCVFAGINGGRHVNPAAAGETVYCWSEILETSVLPDRTDVGSMRVRTIATRDTPCAEFPIAGGPTEGSVLLELDYWLLVPRKSS